MNPCERSILRTILYILECPSTLLIIWLILFDVKHDQLKGLVNPLITAFASLINICTDVKFSRNNDELNLSLPFLFLWFYNSCCSRTFAYNIEYIALNFVEYRGRDADRRSIQFIKGYLTLVPCRVVQLNLQLRYVTTVGWYWLKTKFYQESYIKSKGFEILPFNCLSLGSLSSL